MKILLLNDYGTPHGGAEIATILLRDGLRRRGHDALLLSSSARSSDLPIASDVTCDGLTSGSRTLLQTANFSARRTLIRLLAEFQPDVVHVAMFLTQLSPLILPPLLHRPAVYHAHWLRAICPTGSKLLPDGSTCRKPAGVVCYRSGCLPLRDWIPLMGQMKMWKRWRSSFNRIAANSEATRAALEAEGFANVTVIPCGVSDRPQRPPLTGVPTAFFCGRLVKQKGVAVLLKAWTTVLRRIPDARLLIAGDGGDRNQLENAAPAGVTFLGTVLNADIDRLAAPAWIHVVPSLGFEGFGLVAAEAMMRGTAVVASNIGGLHEVVQPDVTGKLVEPNDPGALAAALIAMLLDRQLCEVMGKRGRQLAEQKFSEDTYVERFIVLYETLLEKARRV
jgi:glycosyltransferase involved in cell wall biosynthesis